jgi:hypothetical protein
MYTEKLWHYFDNYTEFIEAADSKPDTFKHSSYFGRSGNYWMGNDVSSYQDALNLARLGWTAGRNQVSAIAEQINLAGHVRKPDIMFDVTGDGGFDMGKVISGEPESMMYFQDTEVEHTHGKIIRMLVNTTISGGLDESVYRARGAAIVALVDCLESAGYRLDIAATFCEESVHSDGVFVPIKKSDEHLQIDQVAFALAHPSFPRCFAHQVIGHGIRPGDPQWLISKQEIDIYIPMMHLYEKQWQTPTSTAAWIKNYLKEYGVSLDTE